MNDPVKMLMEKNDQATSNVDIVDGMTCDYCECRDVCNLAEYNK